MRIGFPEVIVIFALMAGLAVVAVFIRRLNHNVPAAKTCSSCGRPVVSDSDSCRACGASTVFKAL
jgi:uncharacterized OB-fold protein